MSRRSLLSSVAVGLFLAMPAIAEAKQVCLVGPEGEEVFVRNRAGERITEVASYTLADARYSISSGKQTRILIRELKIDGFVQSRFVRDARLCEGLVEEPTEPTEPTSPTEPTEPTRPTEPEEPESPVVTEPEIAKPSLPVVGTDPFDCSGSTECNRKALYRMGIAGRHTLGYNGARERMFQYVDAVMDHGEKQVQSVYSNDVITIRSGGIPQDGFNTEHTWPQSYLKRYPNFESSRADIYHLFPTESRINGARGNLPFIECQGEPGGNGRVPEFCNGGFEAPEQHKGIVARAMFYISLTYNMPIDARQESVLRSWNAEYPVTEQERTRARRIHEVQGNVNPFVEHPEWIELISDF